MSNRHPSIDHDSHEDVWTSVLSTAPRPVVIVLRNGRIYSGDVTHIGDIVTLVTPTKRIRIRQSAIAAVEETRDKDGVD